MTSKQADRLLVWLVGAVVVLGGSWGGVSLILQHPASLLQTIGAVLLEFVMYSTLQQQESE